MLISSFPFVLFCVIYSVVYFVLFYLLPTLQLSASKMIVMLSHGNRISE